MWRTIEYTKRKSGKYRLILFYAVLECLMIRMFNIEALNLSEIRIKFLLFQPDVFFFLLLILFSNS